MHPDYPAVRLPAASLAALADRCGAIGEDGVSALRESGRVAGEVLFDGLSARLDPETEDVVAFWDAVDRELGESGLGPLAYRVLDGGVAAVSLAQLPEAGLEDVLGRSGVGCHFFTGLLGGLLARAAADSIAVVEIECRADGAPACRFLVGGEDRVSEIRDRLASGAALREVLEAP